MSKNISLDRRIAVGSTSRIKLAAVEGAVARAQPHLFPRPEINGFETDSEVPSQPVGYAAIYTGARNRARCALKLDPQAQYAIGIESGLVLLSRELWFDIAWVTISDRAFNLYEAPSAGFPIPRALGQHCQNTGDEIGPLVQLRAGGGEKDPHKYFSRNMIERQDLIQQALECAFSTLLNSDLYE